MKILLLQVRDDADAERQEVACFEQALGSGSHELDRYNLVAKPTLRWRDVEAHDILLLGGAGQHSVTQTYDFSQPLDEVLFRWIEADRPFFGSCYGHHVLGRLFGGEVVEDAETEEIGTFEISLTEAGRADPLFACCPAGFPAQLGHHDRVRNPPRSLVELARSRRCGLQAMRVDGRPAYSTQFHPEITEAQMRDRLMIYRESYLEGVNETELLERLAPTPHANRLLARFVELHA